MKKKIFLLGLFVGLVAIKAPIVFAQTSGSGESIANYAVSLNLEQSGVLHVSEDITYDFGSNQKHGIFRTIPLYPDGWPELGIDVTDVTDPTGAMYPFSANESSGDLNIKIGDPDVLVTGTKEYVITYDVTSAIRSFSDHDELYWNAIGTEWSVPVKQASVVVTLPPDISVGASSTYCYVGATGSHEEGCATSINQAGVINVNVLHALPSNNGLTVSVSMPRGSIMNTVQKTFGSTMSGYTSNNVFPLIILASIFAFFFSIIIVIAIWGKKKTALIPKELKHVPIAPYYSIPDGLSASQIGYLENRIFDVSDFTAIILDLAVRGFLKLTYIPKDGLLSREDYELTSLKPYDEGLPPEYRPVYNLFFEDGPTTRVSSIGSALGSEVLSKTGKLVAKDFIDAGYLEQPQAGKTIGMIIAFLFLGVFISIFAYPPALFVMFIAAFISIIVAVKKYAVRFTPKGIELMKKVLGFKMFLTLTEEDRVKLMDAPKASQDSFEAILPYAIALGVEQQWVKQFESMTILPPRWINDPRYRNGFNVGMFVASFHSFNAVMRSSTTVSGSGAGGGGSVGGGGGGGGGGSW